MMLAVSLGELLSLPVIQRSGAGLMVAGTFMPVVGVLIIGFDILTVRFAVMHVALLGLALGLWIGVDPTLLALLLCAGVGTAITPLAGRPGGLSGPMGLLMTITAAAALLVAVATGCAPMPTAPPAPGPNLITNGSFEADAFGRTISGWTVTR